MLRGVKRRGGDVYTRKNDANPKITVRSTHLNEIELNTSPARRVLHPQDRTHQACGSDDLVGMKKSGNIQRYIGRVDIRDGTGN